LFNKINKTILSKFFILLMIVSLFNPVVFAEGDNPTPQNLEDIVPKDNPIYNSIEVLYNQGLLSEDSYSISQRQRLTNYEIALLVSNPLVKFMQSENHRDYDVETIKELDFIINNFSYSLNSLGFNNDIVSTAKEITSSIINEKTQTANQDNTSKNRKVNYNPENLSRSKIAEIQYILGQIGLYTGEVDGLFGSKTKAAIKGYQKEMGLNENGVLSNNLLSNLIETLDTPENLTQLANKELQDRENGKQIEIQVKEKEQKELANNKPKPAEKGNIANNVEIHGSTYIEYNKVDTEGNVPLDEDDDPIYEEEDTFEQVFNLDIIGHIADGIKLVANLKAENEEGLLSEGGELNLEDVRLVGLQDDINKFVVGSQPAVNFGSLSYQSKGENGFSWQHNGEKYSLYTLYTIKDKTFDEDGNEIPLPYKRNTLGLRVATDKLVENFKFGFNILNTEDDDVNNEYGSLVLPNKKSLTIASFTGDYEKDDLTIGTEIAVMDKDDNVNSNEDNTNAFAVLFDIGKKFSENLTANLHLRKVEDDYNAETLVDENAYNKDDNTIDDIESPYNPGESGGTLDLAYAKGNFNGDLTLEYWDGDTEEADTDKGMRASAQYNKDNWGVSYNGEHWNDDGDGYEYKDHTLTGNYRHEFTKEKENKEGKTVKETFATITVEDSINYEEDEAEDFPEITTNTFTLATEITPIEDMVVNMDYTNQVNDKEEDRVRNNEFNFGVKKQFKVNEKFTATPYYNASIENGDYDNPDTEDTYDPYEVESVVQNIGVNTETILIPEELRMLANLSYNDFDVTKGKLDEDGYYISGNEPRKGFEATAGVHWTPQSIELLKGFEVSVSGGKKVYDYEHKDSDKDQDSWTYSAGLRYNKEIADKGNVGAFYNRSEDIDDIEEYETTSEEYGLNASLNIGENTSINASVSEENTIDKSQDKDLSVVNNTIGITTRPVGQDGPSINLSFTQEEYQDKLDVDGDNYKIREVKGTVGGSF